MTYEKMIRVIHKYQKDLSIHEEDLHSASYLCHVKWMLKEMLPFVPGQWEKANRWLGFVQGVLWCEGVYTIEEMKNHNKLS